jgi:DNA-binding NarL/FixJ family response regulator
VTAEAIDRHGSYSQVFIAMSSPAGKPKDSVAVIDKHEAIQVGVAQWCAQAQPSISFAGGYFSAESFLADYPAGRGSEIGVVICDLELTSRRVDFAGLDSVIRAGHRVIVYTRVDADEVILSSVERGAVTYLVKSEGREHLVNAIHAARTDTPYVGPRMAAALANDRRLGRPNLAPREMEVLLAWFRTESKGDVARQLRIAPTTVRTHLQRVRAKYAAVGRPATSKAALVARAIQDGIISVDDL